eukprot:8153806-Pyramimonas_sp.AAC.1
MRDAPPPQSAAPPIPPAVDPANSGADGLVSGAEEAHLVATGTSSGIEGVLWSSDDAQGHKQCLQKTATPIVQYVNGSQDLSNGHRLPSTAIFRNPRSFHAHASCHWVWYPG